MNRGSYLASKKYLIWLVAFTLLFNTGSRYGQGTPSAPIKHLRQTEATVHARKPKATRYVEVDVSTIPATPPAAIPDYFSYRDRAAHHTVALALILKKSATHFIPSLHRLQYHGTIVVDDEHPASLKG